MTSNVKVNWNINRVIFTTGSEVREYAIECIPTQYVVARNNALTYRNNLKHAAVTTSF